MGFKIEGEVVIDARKGTTALRAIQGEATKTSQSFDKSGASTKQLAKSLLHLGASGGSAAHSFMQLARLGTAGIIGAAAVGGINKFGEAVKNSANDYYETQKSLAGAFETSFKSKNEDEARKGLEATEEIIDRLRGKITQMGSLGKIMGGFEKLTGINLGFGDVEKELKEARANLVVQEKILEIRQKEAVEIQKIEKQSRGEVSASKSAQETLRINKELQGGKSIQIALAEEELKQATALRDENSKILDVLIEGNTENSNKEQINARNIKAAELELGIYKAQNNVLRANKNEKGESFKQGRGVAGGVLGATPAGRQAMDTATKRRERELKIENARTADELTGREIDPRTGGRAGQQREREKLAAQQAAASAPSLAEQIQGQRTGVDPAQLAATNASQRFEDQRRILGKEPTDAKGMTSPKEEAFSSLLKAIEALSNKLPAAVAR